ncbi:MAG: hypothetical protein WC476_13125 [Phycisphaerae bacterium]|jgi:5-methylcytosine-specific restriction endonuclease McrA
MSSISPSLSAAPIKQEANNDENKKLSDLTSKCIKLLEENIVDNKDRRRLSDKILVLIDRDIALTKDDLQICADYQAICQDPNLSFNQLESERKKQKKQLKTQLRTALRDAIKNNRISKRLESRGIDTLAIKKHLGERPSKDHHIDHIIPLSAFDLNNPEEIKLAFAPENHQWLESATNFRKTNLWVDRGVERKGIKVKINGRWV